MNATEPQPVNSPLQLMPIAKAFTTRHLTDESLLAVNPSTPDRYVESHMICINTVSKVVKDMGGYFHGGLND